MKEVIIVETFPNMSWQSSDTEKVHRHSVFPQQIPHFTSMNSPIFFHLCLSKSLQDTHLNFLFDSLFYSAVIFCINTDSMQNQVKKKSIQYVFQFRCLANGYPFHMNEIQKKAKMCEIKHLRYIQVWMLAFFFNILNVQQKYLVYFENQFSNHHQQNVGDSS